MFLRINESGKFSCFSAPVMLATFFIEVFLAVFILMTRKLNLSARLAVLLLLYLAIFQLAEYSICESFGFHHDIWARIGFASITLLPPVGLHLVYSIAGKTSNMLVKTAYFLAATWICIFLFGNVMTNSVCDGNFVIFNISEPWESLYYFYYDIILILSMGFGLYFATKQKSRRIKVALYTLVFGYAAFIIPSMIFAFFEKGGGSALPSILCGFAVILAIILSLGVVPKLSNKKK